ncbi:MAG: 2-dehydropantoate 2-reductase [Anaerolineales bacterium]|nr:2-dehydropantoate 2-reductase [Anaerolineales bacterium]
MASEPKIAVVGVGPVGGILAAHLAHAGHYVVSCDIQKPHLDAIKERGLSITGVTNITADCKRVAYSISELINFPEIDTLIVATKASILPELILEITKLDQPGMRIISCQNGLDNEEFLAETFDPDEVLRIVINYGGSQMGDGNIHMSFFNPPNYIGAMTSQGEPLARQLAEMLTEAQLETWFTTDIKKYEWEKVVLNAALNPVCALTRKPMKDMMDLKRTEFLVEELLREGIAVAEAAGITFDEGFFEHGIQYLKKAGYHRTSMHQDVLRQVPTEIDWISCKIVEWGRTHGVQTPYNLAIAALIKGLEMESGAPEQ